MLHESKMSAASYALPLGFSLCATGVFACLFSKALYQDVVSEASLYVVSIIYVAAAAVIHITSISAAHRIFEDHIDAPRSRVTLITWSIVAWVPLIILLVTMRSPWITLLLPGIMVLSVMLSSRPRHDSEPALDSATFENGRAELFASKQSATTRFDMCTSFVAAVALESAIAGFFNGHYAVAGFLLAGVAVLPIWVLRSQIDLWGNTAPRKPLLLTTTTTALVLLLTVLAFKLSSRKLNINGSVAGLLGVRAGANSRPIEALSTRHSDTGFQAIIFLIPKHPKELLSPVRNVVSRRVGVLAKHLKINFDGVYWFFQIPDVRPAANARVMHGDPLKANVHSVDRWPIRMEAHQWLLDPIGTDCCQSLLVTLTDGDRVPGEVSVEVVLSDGDLPGDPQVSLGEKIIPSTIGNSLERSQVDETLRFRFPNHSSLKSFNQITVRITPGPERDLAAPNVAIRSFDLMP